MNCVKSSLTSKYNVVFIMSDGPNADFGWPYVSANSRYSIGIWNLDKGGFCVGSDIGSNDRREYIVTPGSLTQGTYVCILSVYDDTTNELLAQNAIKFAYSGFNNFVNLGYYEEN